MTRSDDKLLNDIRRMCAVAADLVARGRPALDGDAALWLAAERAGEAAGKLSDSAAADYPAVEWRELRGTRVILAHAYHRVDRDLLWDILDTELPKVAAALGPVT